MRVRILPCQLCAKPTDRGSRLCSGRRGFDSLRTPQARVAQLAEASGLGPEGWGFDSLGGYFEKFTPV